MRHDPPDPPSQRPLRWRLPKRVVKEMANLGLRMHEASRVDRLMKEYLAGKAVPKKDFKHLRDDVSELRVSCDRREVRLYFARIKDEAILLGLYVNFKKKQNDRDAVEKAIGRLKQYRRGELD